MKKAALIPSFEPDQRLAVLAKELCESGFEVVVVDDGSGEHYGEYFAACRDYAVILTHWINKGKGAALKTGLDYISGHFGECVVVTLDSDGQHTVSDAVRVCEKASADKGSLVLGCRSFGKDVPLRSRFGNKFTRMVYKLSTGTDVSDTQTGLRAFHSSLIPMMLEISGERYEYEMNVLLEAPERGVPVAEVPIDTIYIDGNSGSHFSALRDSFRIYKEILKFSASSLAGFAVDYLMYTMLTVLTGIPALANVGARVVSSIVNFSLNRKFVFRSDTPLVSSAVKYFALAAVILAGNTMVLSALTNGLGMNVYFAKIVTELAFFVLSWTVQKTLIFRKKLSPQKEMTMNV